MRDSIFSCLCIVWYFSPTCSSGTSHRVLFCDLRGNKCLGKISVSEVLLSQKHFPMFASGLSFQLCGLIFLDLWTVQAKIKMLNSYYKCVFLWALHYSFSFFFCTILCAFELCLERWDSNSGLMERPQDLGQYIQCL